MIGLLGIGIGAGVVSALLFAVVITGSPLSILLSYAAPLPILIAALGWNHRSGLIGAIFGTCAIALLLRPSAGAAYALGSAFPAWWLGYLALLAQPAAAPPTPSLSAFARASSGEPHPAPVAPALDWYPLGRLLLWIVTLAAGMTLAGVIAIGGGDYAAFHATLRGAVETVMRFQLSVPAGTPLPNEGLLTPNVLNALVAGIPLLAASVLALVLTLNLWIAAKVVAISKRLARPWPVIADTRMPPIALGLGLAALALGFANGFPGVAGFTLAGALLIGFALQGLALLHDLTRGRPGRGLLLGIAYAVTLLFGHLILPLLALAGMADTAFRLRRAKRPNPSQPRLP